MAYNETLANRIREILADAGADVFEKKMFSGLSFLVDNKLCVSVAKNDRMLIRLAPADYEEAAEINGVELMMRNGKAMKGYVFVHAEILKTDNELKHWVDMALAFNPFAKSSKQKN
ncbi:MAG: TfoX/Sxy family protein [Mucilaginibacter sp.]